MNPSHKDVRLPHRFSARVRRMFLGKPRDVKDSALAHKLSLIAFLAWVGLGADGLSSSAYGPEEAYRQLGQHTYLAILLAAATALTVFIISRSEEHTSELQSLRHLVCRLLLEKKKR